MSEDKLNWTDGRTHTHTHTHTDTFLLLFQGSGISSHSCGARINPSIYSYVDAARHKQISLSQVRGPRFCLRCDTDRWLHDTTNNRGPCCHNIILADEVAQHDVARISAASCGGHAIIRSLCQCLFSPLSDGR